MSGPTVDPTTDSRGTTDAVKRSPRRDAILHVAATEFAANGFHATTVRDLSRAVGLTQPMLYYHVGNKEQFLLSICESLLDALIVEVSSLVESSEPPPRRLADFFERELTVANRHPAEIAVYLRERQTLAPEPHRKLRVKQKTLEAVLRAILEDGSKDGSLVFDSLELTAHAIWAILNANATFTSSDPATPIESYAAKLSALVIEGMRPRE